MQKLQLYIEGQRIDLFDDESIVLTQTIQNVKELDKVFTDFSKTFNLPATKINNKVFKHYYNFDISNGFDGRTKKDATIELNNLNFRDGKIKLEGVKLKNNIPYSYRVTFFGNTVKLKDLFGEDKLSALTSLTSFDKVYAPSDMQSALQLDPATNDVIAPLISHTQRFFYDSSNGSGSNIAGNLFYHNGAAVHGVYWSDLKYAIRLDAIIKAIEDTYEITFSDDFFVDTNAPYYNLFVWLHRKKGDVQSPSGMNASIVDGWSTQTDNDTRTKMSTSSLLTVSGDVSSYTRFELVLTPNAATPYSVSLQVNGIEVYNTGTISNSIIIDTDDFSVVNGGYSIFISSEADLTFTDIVWNIDYRPSVSEFYTVSYSTSTYSHINDFDFSITQQIPEIKVIDFLTSVFKTFNLTAFVDQFTNEIVVKTLDDFYSVGVDYDITKYVETDNTSVDVALPFREVNFEHGDTNTLLAKNHEQLFGKSWGKTEYTGGEKLDGQIFNVKTSFSQMKYERLIDENDSVDTTIQYGFFVDDNQEPYFGLPLLFYPIRQTGGTTISFLNSDVSKTPLTNYVIPSNSLALSSATSKVNINFNVELNEYQRVLPNDFTDSLFEVYYKNYIQDVFNPTNRLTKVTAYLPLRILLNYTLADRFIIKNNKYKINSIQTNLITGKCQLELLNDL